MRSFFANCVNKDANVVSCDCVMLTWTLVQI